MRWAFSAREQENGSEGDRPHEHERVRAARTKDGKRESGDSILNASLTRAGEQSVLRWIDGMRPVWRDCIGRES
jgi:hypothetical protein